jgi:hypothetical protein
MARIAGYLPPLHLIDRATRTLRTWYNHETEGVYAQRTSHRVALDRQPPPSGIDRIRQDGARRIVDELAGPLSGPARRDLERDLLRDIRDGDWSPHRWTPVAHTSETIFLAGGHYPDEWDEPPRYLTATDTYEPGQIERPDRPPPGWVALEVDEVRADALVAWQRFTWSCPQFSLISNPPGRAPITWVDLDLEVTVRKFHCWVRFWTVVSWAPVFSSAASAGYVTTLDRRQRWHYSPRVGEPPGTTYPAVHTFRQRLTIPLHEAVRATDTTINRMDLLLTAPGTLNRYNPGDYYGGCRARVSAVHAYRPSL